MTRKQTVFTERTSRSFVAMTAVAIFLFSILLSSNARAYTPESPEVQNMIDRGIAFLEDFKYDKRRDGYPMLTAYAHLKVRHDPDHPMVKYGIQLARNLTRQLSSGNHEGINYQVGLSIMLLAEADAVAYRPELNRFLQYLNEHQKPNGSYGYEGQKTGDTSQMQYASLGLWTLDRLGLEVDLRRMDRLMQFAIRCQDVKGVWPYQGKLPPGGQLIAQNTKGMSHSTGYAGASAMLITSDIFRMWGDGKLQEQSVKGMPVALKEYKEEEMGASARMRQTRVTPDAVLNSVRRFETFLQREPYKRNPGLFHYYMMYTKERYESFREIQAGKAPAEPDWYNRGVQELMRNQGNAGSWGHKQDRTSPHEPDFASTSFALLFLIRSTKKAIGSLSEGVVKGGYGLPTDKTNVRQSGTSIKANAITSAVTDLLDVLEGDDPAALDGKSIPDNLRLPEDPEQRKQQVDRLVRMVRGSQSWQARRVAARLLGTTGELRVVPALIFGLSDGDKRVRLYSRDGLRAISRKFEGFGMPDDLDKPEQAIIYEKKWKKWYLTVEPDYIFLE